MKPIGKTLTLLLIFFCSSAAAQSTNVFIVQFEDKENKVNAEDILSKKAIERRLKFGIKLDEIDYPVNSQYVSAILKDTAILLRYTLKWQNAAVVSADTQSLEHLKKIDFVKNVRYVGKANKIRQVEKPKFQSPRIKLKESIMETKDLTASDYGASYGQNNQIGIVELHQKGLNGRGVYIAIFDAGFKNINSIPSFLKHQANGKLMYGYDVAGLDNELNNSDNHGTSCLSCFGAYDKGKYIGSAPLANVILFRTEFAATEYPVEELNWCKAAEQADSLGVDMITSSLGYNRFDDKSLSYTHKDLDGNTSYISKSATIAVTKGIVVLNSAGNEGDDEWRKIGTPADVPSVITVGAVGLDNIPG
ncbi:S8 family serine peptidase, partial [Bacteroidia bacterium]|nr:S8 family serine peptidase [Bacteroidia bacterium]